MTFESKVKVKIIKLVVCLLKQIYLFIPTLFLKKKRTLGPCVTHLRMTDQWSGTICEILVECIMRNNWEIILNFGQWFRGRCCLKDFLSGVLAVLLFGEAESFMQF